MRREKHYFLTAESLLLPSASSCSCALGLYFFLLWTSSAHLGSSYLLFGTPQLHCKSIKDLATQAILGNVGARGDQDKHLFQEKAGIKQRLKNPEVEAKRKEVQVSVLRVITAGYYLSHKG